MQSPSSTTTNKISRLAILGPGLLGGSVARAARQVGLSDQICLWARRDEAVEEIDGLGIVDQVSTNLAEIAEGADFVVIATPVGAIADLAARLLKSGIADGAVVTDVGSVKAPVIRELSPLFANARASFVGSHPMAGAEQAGIGASRADLFEGAACILTPDGPDTDRKAVSAVGDFWRRLGCRIFEMPADEHDTAVAAISHVPHIAAAALVKSALGHSDEAASLVGTGFLDTTRVASGSAELWKEILLENRESVISSLASLRENLTEVLEFLENSGDDKLRQFLQEAKDLRDSCLRQSVRGNASDAGQADDEPNESSAN